jgi:CBS-domain-containing membrane protein
MARIVEGAVAGIGGGLAIASLSSLSDTLAVPLLLAPFGASCVLVFGVPASPFAQPRNVIGGYLVSASVGLAAVALLGGGAAGLAVGVGLAITAMMLTHTIHPPAGAVPIIVGLTHPDLWFLAAPVGAGAVLIVLIGMAYRRLSVAGLQAVHKSRQNAVADRGGAPR